MASPGFGIIVLACVFAGLAPSTALAQFRTAKAVVTANSEANALLEKVPAAFRDAVAKIVTRPTMATKAHEDPFTVTTAVYRWMLDHPDRVSLAWQRLDVPCVDITAAGKTQFAWQDENGSRITWEPVAVLDDGIIWLASGTVKPAALVPMVPVKAVAWLKFASVETKTPGLAVISPEIQIWLQTDHKAANAVVRLAGPAAPKMAEDGAGQLLYFYSGIGKYLQKNPAAAQGLLSAKER
jgi:hypothetical protein